MKNKNKFIKIIGSTVIVGAFLFLAAGSENSKNTSDSTNSSSSNAEMHTCTTCGKEYEGGGYAATSDGVGGDLSLDQGDIFTECMICAQKDMDRMNEARSHKGSLAY